MGTKNLASLALPLDVSGMGGSVCRPATVTIAGFHRAGEIVYNANSTIGDSPAYAYHGVVHFGGQNVEASCIDKITRGNHLLIDQTLPCRVDPTKPQLFTLTKSPWTMLVLLNLVMGTLSLGVGVVTLMK